ncbi:MAG: ribonuclease P protein component [Eubacteriales bacterium]|nr:ribonuclease P protein component [Eubacteriales bacterium]
MKCRKQILRNQRNFNSVYRKGSSRGSRFVVILYKKNRMPVSRVAFVASKKVGNSVCRNRARRLMRESIRTMGVQLKPGYDIIFVARNSINGKKCPEVQRTLKKALRSCNLIKE